MFVDLTVNGRTELVRLPGEGLRLVLNAGPGCGQLDVVMNASPQWYFRLTLLVVLLIPCLEVGCSKSTSKNREYDPGVRYSASLFTKAKDGTYVLKGDLRWCHAPVPSDAGPIEDTGGTPLSVDIAVTIRCVKLGRRTATFVVGCGGVTKEVVATCRGTDVLFDAGRIKVTVFFGGGTIPPFQPGSTAIKPPTIAYKLDCDQVYTGRIDECGILETKPIEGDTLHAEVRQILADPGNVKLWGDNCFEPGLAFRFGEGDEAIDITVCLGCCWVRVREATEDRYLDYGLTDKGKAKLMAIYKDLFGEAERTAAD